MRGSCIRQRSMQENIPQRLPPTPALSRKERGRPSLCWLLAGLLLLTLLVRLPGVARPLVGNFATKNVVYAMIARNWAEGRSDFRYPTLDCLAAGQRSLHMLELPCSAYLTGWLWKTLGGSLDVWGRATAIGFSLASVSVLFCLVRRRHGPVAAAGAATTLAISPVSIVYGQSFMLEASLVFFTVGTVWCLDRWLAGGRRAWLPAAALCLSLLLLTKIYMLVMLLPLAAMILRRAPHARSCRERPLWRSGRSDEAVPGVPHGTPQRAFPTDETPST